MIEKTVQVKGMHCASCSAIITKKVSAIPGVSNVNVNVATENAQIAFDPDKTSIEAMNEEIGKLGYTFAEKEKKHEMHDMNDPNMDHSMHTGLGQSESDKAKELSSMKMRAQFVLPIALLAFVIMIWEILARIFASVPNIPLPMQFMTVLNLALATVVLFWIGQPFLNSVLRFIRYRVANMDTLIGIGTLAAYLYSTIITLLPNVREFLRLPEYTYFDVTIVVIGFVIFGKYLEARSKQKTGEAIKKLLGLQAKSALVLRDGKEIEIPLSDVVIGDTVIVKPGGKIPVDGKIVFGSTSVDESMITGESIPVERGEGDLVIGSTINKQGSIRLVATKVGNDTYLAQIIAMVESAQGSRAPIQGLADKISSIFVPTVLGIAVVTFLLWITIGTMTIGFSSAFSYAILSFVGVLVIACPCALGLATPTAIIVGVGKGAEAGILIRNAEALERLSKVDTVVLDKTGTITKGKPEVTDILVFDRAQTKEEILKIAASIESHSEHPLAEAIVESAKEKKVALLEATNFSATSGVGVEARVNGEQFSVKKPEGAVAEDDNVLRLEGEGKTVVVLYGGQKAIGAIALADTLKNEAKEAIKALHAKGIKVVMLTGDNERTANFIAGEANIDTVIARVLPEQKADKVRELQAKGSKVAMAGDGINDAPALAQADVGIAMATGTDVAIESAGITLLHGDISKLARAITLSKITMRGIKQNLFWAFIYNVIGIPLAAGLFYPIFGIFLSPVFAGLAMAFSSVSVISNSLRIKTKKI